MVITDIFTGAWVWSKKHRQSCLVIETQTLWENHIVRLWLPTTNVVIQVPADDLEPILGIRGKKVEEIGWISAAARVSEALTQNVLLAPLEADIIPLSHQIRALSRAVAGGRVRYLLADEVGLGKTIEAGLILRELKLRGRIKRTLIVAPRGITLQWVAEMKNRFGEDFRLIVPGELGVSQRINNDENLWKTYDQVIVPMDSVKPMERRKGWSQAQVQAYNRERFEDLVTAGWDLVIVDEAHRLGGSTDQVARYRLGEGLTGAAPYVLFLSATPHQGKTDAFFRLVNLLDDEQFPEENSVTHERVQPYVIRTEKRQAIDQYGQPLFKPRTTRRIPIAWLPRHQTQRLLYAAVSEYVRQGYNQALLEKRNYIGFLMTLMQRLVTSSTAAIRTTLERRLEVLRSPEEQLSLFPMLDDADWGELDSEEEVESLVHARLSGLKNEQKEVELLLETARRCEQQGPDVKAEALLEWIYKIQQEESAPDLKVLIFTEFVSTQKMLSEYLRLRGFSVVCLNGSMGMDERQQVQVEFAGMTQILISTEAGGEGLNLQFCHVVINYDVPWNPMRLEQRIGRVDRIGQAHAVRALNFLLQDTVENRVQEVLEAKLKIIFDEFGIDKTGDVLDSSQAEALFDKLYIQAMVNPDQLEENVELAARLVEEQARIGLESTHLIGSQGILDPAFAKQSLDNPIPYWLEKMTIQYLRAQGHCPVHEDNAWILKVDQTRVKTKHKAVEKSHDALVQNLDGKSFWFTPQDKLNTSESTHLSLDSALLRSILQKIPSFVSEEPIPVISLVGIPETLHGLWSLWQVSVFSAGWSAQRLLPLFINDQGRTFLPTGRSLWDILLGQDIQSGTGCFEVQSYLERSVSLAAFEQCRVAAESHGKSLFVELSHLHQHQLDLDHQKGEYAFQVRHRVIERVGLPAVRAHRLALLAQEQQSWTAEINQRTLIQPELNALLILKIQPAVV
ncbi:MAG: helicase [Chloroflexi bacterium GWB2_49_20]|nr:MAG: helicase [Chloroflexi bacterium GWB2_49_20]OGN78397.1 MAG: helicase [Chloroflexi bacterium GWC2_49_37]OGN84139.1 MAG: helicase [Chloroflexi bacterium GWD2_49_16]HBG75211.1 helicase [Anaerolineae bacterium]HCC79154.1 helicase [Anaerolineae bacterium]